MSIVVERVSRQHMDLNQARVLSEKEQHGRQATAH